MSLVWTLNHRWNQCNSLLHIATFQNVILTYLPYILENNIKIIATNYTQLFEEIYM